MGGQKDPTRPDEPETSDDLATAEAKSRSMDERVPETYGTDRAKRVDRPVPAAFIPQGGVATPHGADDTGPGEEVLEKEREHLRLPKQRG